MQFAPNVAGGARGTAPAIVSLRVVSQTGGALSKQSPTRESTARADATAPSVDDSTLRELFEAAPEAMVVVDAAGRLAIVNIQAEQMFGYGHDELLNTDPNGLFEAHHSGLFMRRSDEPQADAVAEREVVGRRRDGSEFALSISLRWLPGDPPGPMLAVLRDISGLRAAQQRQLESERLVAIGQMAAGLAHESRNALQQIGACAEMLAMELVDNPEALDLVIGVQEAEGRLLKLFDDVRAYAVPLRLERQPADLAELWRGVWNGIAASRSATIGRLIEEIAGVDLRCRVDTVRIQQMFRHLLENAWDAASQPLEMEISAREIMLDGRPALALTLRDNGSGLSGEQRRRAFEPFFTTKTQGTGLGLSIVRRIIEIHGGHIELGETHPGTQFLVMLPRDA